MRRFLLVFFLLLVTGFVFANDVNLLNGLRASGRFDKVYLQAVQMIAESQQELGGEVFC